MAITEGIGPGYGATGITGRREPVAPSVPSQRPESGRSEPSAGQGVGRHSDLGRLYADRGRVWAEAVQVRQQDRKLARVAEKASAVQAKLDQVKLYPPYPIDEPRRAEAIREFNGLAAEVRKMIATGAAPSVTVTSLPPAASTAQAEQASVEAGQVNERFTATRIELAGSFGTVSISHIEAESVAIGSGLGDTGAGITRGGSDLLVQL